MGHAEILEGREGWLFLLGGTNEVGRLLSEPDSIGRHEISSWRDVIESRGRRLSNNGIRYLHFCVPDKISVYRQFLPEPEAFAHSPRARIFEEPEMQSHSDVLLDVLPELLAANTSELLYWKTDTHWTYAGACAAHRALCRRLAAEWPADLHSRPKQEKNLILDLGSKVAPPRTEMWSSAQILRDSRLCYRNAMARFIDILAPRYHSEMHGGISVGYENASASCDPRTVLIFGDSYCEYRPNSLTALLAETFRRVRFVWSNSVDFRLVEEFKPDIVITEIAERFVKRIPDDSVDLERLVMQRISTFLNRQCCEKEGSAFSWTPASR